MAPPRYYSGEREKGEREGCFFISLLFLHHFTSLLSVGEGLKIRDRSRN